MQQLLQYAAYIKKALVAASAALVTTGQVFSDGQIDGSWVPPTGEKLTLLTAWLAVFGVYWFTNAKKPTDK